MRSFRRTGHGAIPFFVILAMISTPLVHAQTVPTPESVLGHKIGEDFYLATYDEALVYMKELAAASDRVRLIRVGETSHGLEWYAAVISSPQNLADLEEHKETARRLAWAKGLSDEEARNIAASGKVIVHIDGGLHASEAACAQHTIQLAHDLAAARNDPQVQRILDDVILLLWFSINPDGQNMVANWYRRNLGTPFEVSSLPMLYQKYVGHDNNRDGYMNNMIESQVATRVTLDFGTQVFYCHHQTAPFPARIWIPPYAEPASSNVHPLMWRWVNLFGTSMAAYLDERGMPGATHRGRGFDVWYPGYNDHVGSYRNAISFFTETALYRYATPRFYTLGDFPREKQGLRAEVLYSSPWQGGWWRLGDAVRYMIGASMSVLDTASKYRAEILFNRYQAGRDTIRRFSNEPPYAYVIPQEQHDPQTAATLVSKLLINGIEVHQTQQPLRLNGQQYEAGAWVVLMDQAFARLVKDLFEVQRYPILRDGPEAPMDLPYDVTGWTLPVQMGVDVVEAVRPIAPEVRSTFARITKAELPPGEVRGQGNRFVFSHQPNAAVKAIHAVMEAGGRVAVVMEETTTPRGSEYGAIVASEIERAAMVEIAGELGIEAAAQSRTSPRTLPLDRPRVGLYRPWSPSMDEGWTRWLFEEYGVEFTNLYNHEVRTGNLRPRYDVIVIADMSARSILNGYQSGTVPAEYAGGIGEGGLEHLRDFVRGGGTLVTFNAASMFAINALGLPVKNALAGLGSDDFFCSGALLKTEIVAPEHPVALGMPDRPTVMFQRGPAFETGEDFAGTVIARYVSDRNPLMSGLLIGPDKIQGKAALIDAPYGEGRVILFGFKPQWRGQSHGTYKLIFNALHYSGEFPARLARLRSEKSEKD